MTAKIVLSWGTAKGREDLKGAALCAELEAVAASGGVIWDDLNGRAMSLATAKDYVRGCGI